MNGRSGWAWLRASGVWFAFASVLAFPSNAGAGPVEVFNSIEVASGDPDRVVARWINGDGGIFVSNDRGASFAMSCYTAVSSALMGRSVQSFKTATDGSLCAGTISQTFCSNADGCGWKEAAELKGQWVADFAEDPIDQRVLYLATGTAEGDNGIYVREAPGAAWKPFGTLLPAWFSRVFVVKRGTGKRVYVSSQENVVTEQGVDGGPPVQEPKYFVRYSDDDAVTWTSHPYGQVPERSNLRLVAVDPTNPDRVVVAIIRTAESMTDDLYYSDKRGEPGSYVKIGTVTAFSGATFTPDGTLWYGDNEQTTPGLYKVAKLGDPPAKVIGSYKVGCVHYDAASERLYVCADWRLGTADPNDGTLSTLFDIRNAAKFLECKDEAPLNDRCGPALRSPNFCDLTHYPDSPVCVTYFGTGGAGGAAAAGGAGAAAGAGGMSIGAGSGGVAGRSAGAGGPGGRAGSAASSTNTGAKRKDSGCSVRAIGGNERDSAWLGLGLALAFIRWRRGRAPRRR